MGGVARKLKVGFESFEIINQPKTDVNLRFSTSNMQHLAALLTPTEQDEFLLLWRPKPTMRPRFTTGGGDSASARNWPRSSSMGGASSHASAKSLRASKSEREMNPKEVVTSLPAPHQVRTLDRSSGDFLIKASIVQDSSSGASVESAALVPAVPVHHGAELSEASAEAVRKMREIPVDWRAFHINLGAYLYCSMFKMPTPANETQIYKPEVMQWLKIKPEDSTITHQFVLYK
jgi:hypothetical protein